MPPIKRQILWISPVYMEHFGGSSERLSWKNAKIMPELGCFSRKNTSET
jgi:hypothetical protein